MTTTSCARLAWGALLALAWAACQPPALVMGPMDADERAGQRGMDASFWCDELLKQHRQTVEALDLSAPYASPEAIQELGQCIVGQDAVWGLVLTRAQLVPENELVEGQWRIIRVDRHGNRTEAISGGSAGGWLAAQDINFWHGFFQTESFRGQLFDFDGDGEDELILSLTSWYHESETIQRVWVVQRQGDQLTDYAPALSFSAREVRDVDQDGRPDLLLDTLYRTYDVCGLGLPWDGPCGAARSLPDGTFSSQDPAMLAYGREQCPNARLVLPAVSVVDEPMSRDLLWDVACARLHGQDPVSLRQELDAFFQKVNYTADPCVIPLADFEQWINVEPPMSIPP